METKEINDLKASTLRIRRRMLKMAHDCGGRSHIGGSLSMTDMLTVLYKKYLVYDASNPLWEGRDYFILSKGHCVLSFYAVLQDCGFIPDSMLSTFNQDGSLLGEHPVINEELGIESSNGSLGQGVSMAVGLAKGLVLKGMKNKVYTLLGDGECNEGSVWEAALLAGKWKLDNLTIIIDNNKQQFDGFCNSILTPDDVASQWESAGFDAQEINGNDIESICTSFEKRKEGTPHVIIGDTIKGYGVSFMEGNNDYHHARVTDKIYEDSLKSLEEKYATNK